MTLVSGTVVEEQDEFIKLICGWLRLDDVLTRILTLCETKEGFRSEDL